MEAYPIIIIGAGPVGGYLAHKLSDAGLRVHVLDAESCPGENVCCSGLISPECFQKINLPEGIKYRKFSEFTVIGPSNQKIDFKFDRTLSYVIDRPELNKLLVQRATKTGATFEFGHKVINLDFEDKYINLKIKSGDFFKTYLAQHVILSTGYASPLNHKLGFNRSRRHRFAAQTEIIIQDIRNIQIYLNNDFAPGGFAWCIPTWNNKSFIGVLCNSKPHFHLNNLITHLVETGRAIRCTDRIKVTLIPFKPEPVTMKKNLLIVGEAAGQVKPLTGGGIYYGIICADIAAEAIIRKFKKNKDNMENYYYGWKKVIGRELLFGRIAVAIWNRLSNQHFNMILKSLNKLRLHEVKNLKKHFYFDWHFKTMTKIALGYLQLHTYTNNRNELY